MKDLGPYVEKVLDALQKPKAWVSSSTKVRDLSPIDEKQNREFIGRASARLGFTVSEKDCVIGLAKKLQANEEKD